MAMDKHGDILHNETDVLKHPAVMAWNSLRGGQLTPTRITVLKPEHRKSSVYRLHGLGLNGSTIVAKRCRNGTALIEQKIYQHILPHLSVSQLYFYGSVGASDHISSWLFLEDAGDGKYSSDDVKLAALAARWLAVVHLSAPRLEKGNPLPDRGVEYFHRVLQSARATILQSLNNPAFQSDHVETLRSIVNFCDVLEARWKWVENLGLLIPRTLVHSGFNDKNLRVRQKNGALEFLAFDWEAAGWGIPLSDISRVDISTYWSIVHEDWKSIDLISLQLLGRIGKVLWCLAPIADEAPALNSPWIEKVMQKMKYYRLHIEKAMQELSGNG